MRTAPPYSIKTDLCADCRPKALAILDWFIDEMRAAAKTAEPAEPAKRILTPEDTVSEEAARAAVERRRLQPCSLCQAPIGDYGLECNACGVPVHSECFWGRIATLEDFTAYMLKLMTMSDVDFEDSHHPEVLCVACKSRVGLGKDGQS